MEAWHPYLIAVEPLQGLSEQLIMIIQSFAHGSWISAAHVSSVEDASLVVNPSFAD